jgi:diguanylate cyclase (GGDEF)-like protein
MFAGAMGGMRQIGTGTRYGNMIMPADKTTQGIAALTGSTAASTELAQTQSALAEARQDLETLYAALDNVDSGLLLLDMDLRAVYSNPALHAVFGSHSQSEIRERKPPYSELLEAAARAASINIEDYVERRLAWVRSGDPKPMDLAMANGTVLRCHLAVLPGGGRMLIYSDVTDIVRHAEELERLATTDGMTGIYNRRHFMTLADHEWSRARRYARPLSFLMIDIDYFKSINDNFGHQVGDQMIMHLANLARDCKRDCDVLARIGGEEFALLLPETDLDQAGVVAERLRLAVVANPLSAACGPVPGTVSIGVATASEDMKDISELMKASDQALYDAKRAGRNRVICCTPGTEAPSIVVTDMQDARPATPAAKKTRV